MKKFLKTLTLLIVVFSLVACSGSSDDTATNDGGSDNQETIKVGVLQDISGSTATLGKMVEAGVNYAVDEINANGGVDGKMIETITRDTKGDVTEAVSAFELLVTQDQVSAIVGPPVSNIALAIAPISENYDVPVLGFAVDPATLVKEDGSTYKNMFLFQPSDDQQAAMMAKYTVEEIGADKIGIIYRNDNAYSVGLVEGYEDYIEGTDAEIVETVEFKSGDSDYSTMLMKLVNAGAEVIYAPNYTQELITICQQARGIGFDGPIVAGLDAAPPFASLAGETANNVVYVNNITESDPEVQAIIEDYKEESGEDATNKFFLAYDVSYILSEIFEEHGTNPVDVQAAVENIEGYEGLTGTITMDPETHMPVGLEMYVHEIQDGESKLITQYSAE